MLFVPPSMPYMAPAAEASHNFVQPVTDLTDSLSAGTLIEWDLNWNDWSPEIAYGEFYRLDVTIDENGYNGFTEKLGQYAEDTSCISSCPSEIQLIKDGTWDYQLKIDTTGYADGEHRISVQFKEAYNVGLSGGSYFWIGEGDTTPPVVTVPSNQNLIATPPPSSQSSTMHLAMFDWTPTATDYVGVSSIDCDYGSAYLGSVNAGHWYVSFPVGTTTVTCTATDHAGNVGTASFTVIVTIEGAADTTPPVINFGGFNENDILTRTALNSTGYNLRWHVNVYDAGDTTVNAPTCYVNLEPITPVATSFNTYGPPTTQYGAYEYNHLFPIHGDSSGLFTVLCEIDDDAGNHTEVSFVVRVVEPPLDTTPPVVIVPDWDFTVDYDGDDNGNTWVSFGVTVTDEGGITHDQGPLDCTKSPGGMEAGLLEEFFVHQTFLITASFETPLLVGTTTITCNSFDTSNNMGTASFTITVNAPADTTPPEHIALEQFMDDFITATAYVNSTSPTGRTITIINDRISEEQFVTFGGDNFGLDFKIKKGGTTVYDHPGVYRADYWYYGNTWNTHSWSIPIPDGTYYVGLGFPSTGLYTNWTAGTYTIIWDWVITNLDNSVFSGSDSSTFTVPAPPTGGGTGPATLAATAYLNGTSPTGRTLSLVGVDIGIVVHGENLRTSISKDGTVRIGHSVGSTIDINNYWQPTWQIPIPEDWEAGTYNITWDVTQTTNPSSGSTTVTVPALPSDVTTQPTVTATAYFNDTSPTGRTLHLDSNLCANTSDCNAYYSAGIATSLWANIRLPDGSLVSWASCPHPCGLYFNGVPDWRGTDRDQYYFPIPVDWVAGSYDIIWSGSGGSFFDVTTAVTIPALPSDVTAQPTVTATAYVNGTSPTGRTLHLLADDLCILASSDTTPDPVTGVSPACVEFGHNIAQVYGKFEMPDGSYFMTLQNVPGGFPPELAPFKLSFHFYNGNEYFHSYFPIPEDWEAGSYNVVWTTWNGVDFNVTTTVTIPALPGTAETEIVIPSWIKNNAGWWASNQIDDRAFVSGLQWLISNGIMNIPPTVQGAGSDDVIPSWIKNNAGWWADDLIDDRNFVTGLQWLITNGIMIIELE